MAVTMKRVPVRNKDVYEALAASWRAAHIHRTADKATAVANFSYVSDTGTWLVRFGEDNDCDVFPEEEREWSTEELRERFGLTKGRKPSGRPNKAAVLAAARQLAAMVPEVPEEIAAILAAA